MFVEVKVLSHKANRNFKALTWSSILKELSMLFLCRILSRTLFCFVRDWNCESIYWKESNCIWKICSTKRTDCHHVPFFWFRFFNGLDNKNVLTFVASDLSGNHSNRFGHRVNSLTIAGFSNHWRSLAKLVFD